MERYDNSRPNAVVANCMIISVHESPDNFKTNVLCAIRRGDEILVEDIKGDWAHIYTNAGVEGYVGKDYIQMLT